LLTEYGNETDFNNKSEELLLRYQDKEIREENGVSRIILFYSYDEVDGEEIDEISIDRENLRIIYRSDYGPSNSNRFDEYLKEKNIV
jgi:hypothetical protein